MNKISFFLYFDGKKLLTHSVELHNTYYRPEITNN